MYVVRAGILKLTHSRKDGETIKGGGGRMYRSCQSEGRDRFLTAEVQNWKSRKGLGVE